MIGIGKDEGSGLCGWEYGGTITGEDAGIGVDVGVDAGVLTQPEIINKNTIKANVTMQVFFPLSINILQGVTYPR
jgi:hypothetical protein